MNVLEFNYDGKVMYGAALSLMYICLVHAQKYFDLRFSTLISVVFFSVDCIFPGHLEQIAIACPNLRWLDLYKSYRSL